MSRASSILAVTLLLGVGLVAPAEAEHRYDDVSWQVATNFRIGGAQIALVAGKPGYFYRTPARLPAYYGHRCTDRCFVSRGYGYHVPACPLVDAYFHRHRFPASRFWVNVDLGPRYFVERGFVPPPFRRGWVPPGHRKHWRHHGKRCRHHGRHWRRDRRHHRRDHRAHRRDGDWEWDDGRWERDD